MPVLVDQQELPQSLGLRTLGQVLQHLQKENRLVVHVTIDGKEPDLGDLAKLRQEPIDSRTIHVETTEPQLLTRQVLDAADAAVDEAATLSRQAAEQLQSGDYPKAFEHLHGVFNRWQSAQDAIVRISQLLRVDLTRVSADDKTFDQVLQALSKCLRKIRSELEARDYVTLADTLAYELPDFTAQWHALIASVRSVTAPGGA